MDTLIRPYRRDDAAATARVFFDSVRCGTAGYYSNEQREAWAPAIPDLSVWQKRLEPQTVFVAERANAVIGFMSLTLDGCIDLAFISPDAIGTGVAYALYEQIRLTATRNGLTRLHAEASRPGRAFFERQGWHVLEKQTVSRKEVALENFRMEKIL